MTQEKDILNNSDSGNEKKLKSFKDDEFGEMLFSGKSERIFIAVWTRDLKGVYTLNSSKEVTQNA